jgi:hypothetical protein
MDVCSGASSGVGEDDDCQSCTTHEESLSQSDASFDDDYVVEDEKVYGRGHRVPHRASQQPSISSLGVSCCSSATESGIGGYLDMVNNMFMKNQVTPSRAELLKTYRAERARLWRIKREKALRTKPVAIAEPAVKNKNKQAAVKGRSRVNGKFVRADSFNISQSY